MPGSTTRHHLLGVMVMGEPRVSDATEPTGGPRSQRLCDGWEQAILVGLAARYDPASRTGKKLATHVPWALEYFQDRGVDEWPKVGPRISLEFCYAGFERADGEPTDPAVPTARNRQWMLGIGYELAAALGAQVNPRTAIGAKIQRPKRGASDAPVSTRPLTEQELRRACAYADSRFEPTKQTMMFALSLAGGSATDLSRARAKDVDLNKGTVRFAGSGARLCALPAWSADVVARYLDANPATAPDDLLCVTANPAPQRAAEIVSTQLWKMLNDAGFGHEPGIAGRSLRLTAARRALERDGIEAAARLLGSPSLDNTAAALDYQWRQHSPDEVLGRNRPNPIAAGEGGDDG